MDARIDGDPVTERAGKAVEINALWIEAPRHHRRAVRPHRPATPTGPPLRHGGRSFAAPFPAPTGAASTTSSTARHGDDPPCRPNQLLAVSLPHGPSGPTASRVCRAELLPPIGLRSLPPARPGYRGRHRGGPAERDRAYHQGTVWPWLIGPFVDAARRVGGRRRPGRAGTAPRERGLGSVSETADGDAPHRPRLPVPGLVRGRADPRSPTSGGARRLTMKRVRHPGRLSIVLLVVAAACSSGGDGDGAGMTTSAASATTSTTTTLVQPVASGDFSGRALGRPGCKPASPISASEVPATSSDAEAWGLLFGVPKAGEELKVAWHMTGSGDLRATATSPGERWSLRCGYPRCTAARTGTDRATKWGTGGCSPIRGVGTSTLPATVVRPTCGCRCPPERRSAGR